MSLNLLDQNITLFLNGLHHSSLDMLFYIISKKWFSLPIFIVVLFGLYKKLTIKKLGLTILLVALGLTTTDQITSGFMKPHFQRLRPTHNLEIQEKVHTVKGYRGGKYGFASSHAANSFFFSVFMSFIFWRKKATIFLLLWCLMFSYSRIYLGVHYVGDILAGAVLGIITALIFHKLFQYLVCRVSFFRK